MEGAEEEKEDPKNPKLHMPVDQTAKWMISKENVPFIREHGIEWVELHDNKEKCQELIYRVQHQEEKGINNLKEQPP